MARKTFISNKYSEAQELRDTILESLGDDATYYQGETAASPDLTDTTTENIKENIKDMMYNTSVTIAIISPNMIQSKWINWELEYTLKDIKRGDTTSRANGIVGVIMQQNGRYNWLATTNIKPDGCSSRSIDDSKLYRVIAENRFNCLTDEKYSCSTCKTWDWLKGSYVSLIEEDAFLKNPLKYIENAYDKSQRLSSYKIKKHCNINC